MRHNQNTKTSRCSIIQYQYRSVAVPLPRAHAPNDSTHTLSSPLAVLHYQVSPELATQLSDTSLSPEVSPARHALLDQAVRAKIGAEAAHLRGQTGGDGTGEGSVVGVDIVQREIEAALERENLDRERGMVGGGDADADVDVEGAHGDVKNSTVLLGDLEEVRQKVDRYRARASLTEHPEVQKAREAIASCYRYGLTLISLAPEFPSNPNGYIYFCCFFPPERTQRRRLTVGRKSLRFALRLPSWSRLHLFVDPFTSSPITDPLSLPAIRRIVTVTLYRPVSIIDVFHANPAPKRMSYPLRPSAQLFFASHEEATN